MDFCRVTSTTQSYLLQTSKTKASCLQFSADNPIPAPYITNLSNSSQEKQLSRNCHTDWKNLTIFLYIFYYVYDFALAKSNPCDTPYSIRFITNPS